jgi:hypothetical protein
MAEGRTPGRLSSYELGVSARLGVWWTELLMPSRRRHRPDPARSRRYTAGWIGLPGCGRREVLGRSVRAMGTTGIGCGSRATGSGRDIARRLGAVTHPIAAAMTAARVSCTSTSGAAASASTATTSAFRQGRSAG